MTHESLETPDWESIVAQLGGAEMLAATARATKAFLRPREIKSAVDLLRLVFAYCLRSSGLRGTATWATAVGLANISGVGVLLRLRQCGDWLALLIGQVLAVGAPAASQGRMIRIIDGTCVPQADTAAVKQNKLWRIHSAFDLPSERFGHFELTDQSAGETIDRIPVIAGEIRLGDRAYLQPDRIAKVLDAGADIVVRAGWKGARWQDAEGEAVDLIALLRAADGTGLLDRPIWIALKSKKAAPLALRLIAVKKPPQAAEAARRTARQNARRGGHQICKATLVAADWVILVTSLQVAEFSTSDVLALYRLRWRIELGFKRLKSLIGLKSPAATNPDSARPWLLAHLLMILLIEPRAAALDDSPRWAQAA